MDIYHGNANTDGADYRGWFVGDFLGDEADNLRKDKTLEVKYSHHPAGETRGGWAAEKTRKTMGIIISGKCKMIFRDRETLLESPGDYVIWGPGVEHDRLMVEDGIILTIRWEQ